MSLYPPRHFLRESAEALLAEYRGKKAVLSFGGGAVIEALIQYLHQSDSLQAFHASHFLAASEGTKKALIEAGQRVSTLSDVLRVDAHINAPEVINEHGERILPPLAISEENLLAVMARSLVSLVHEEGFINTRFDHPFYLEVLPFARSFISRQLVEFGMEVEHDETITADSGLEVLCVEAPIGIPSDTESHLRSVLGVVGVSLMAKPPSDYVYIAGAQNTQFFQPQLRRSASC